MTGKTIDEILDSGGDGLRFFAEFLPRYRTWTGCDPAGGDEDSLTERYDRERGMDLEALRSFATTLRTHLDGALGDGIRTQQACCAELPSRWSGSPGADRADHYVRVLHKQIGGEYDTLAAVARAVSAAADTLERAVRTKVNAMRGGAAAGTVAGKTGEQIDSIISHAHNRFGSADRDGARELVRRALPEIGAEEDPAAYCAHWLATVFVPAVNDKVSGFVTLTDAAQATINREYDTVIGILAGTNRIPYRSPDGSLSQTANLGHNDVLAGQHSAVRPASLDVSGIPAPSDGPAAPHTAPAGRAPDSARTRESSDMGLPGVWRPGDIANVLNAAGTITGTVPDILAHLGDPLLAVGSAVKDIGAAVKDVGVTFLGSEGIPGLMREGVEVLHAGVEAAQQIDALLSHHDSATRSTAGDQTALDPGRPGEPGNHGTIAPLPPDGTSAGRQPHTVSHI